MLVKCYLNVLPVSVVVCLLDFSAYIRNISLTCIDMLQLQYLVPLLEKLDRAEDIPNHKRLSRVQVAALKYRGFDIPNGKYFMKCIYISCTCKLAFSCHIHVVYIKRTYLMSYLSVD